jgi:hypothetical protein
MRKVHWFRGIYASCVKRRALSKKDKGIKQIKAIESKTFTDQEEVASIITQDA